MKLPNRLSCELGAAVKAALRSHRRRQNVLAGKLGITTSAVSQIMHGRLMPDLPKMRVILDFIGANHAEREFLLGLWRRNRLGDFSERSDFNRCFLALRSNRGLSLQQLTARTGLSMARLTAFDEDPSARATAEERAVLAEIFECSPDQFDFVDGMTETGVPALVEAADSGDFGTPSLNRSLPLLSLAELSSYRSGSSLIEFADRVASSSLSHLPLDVICAVAVTVDSRELSLGLPGRVQLILAENRPLGYQELDLVFCRDGEFRICMGHRPGCSVGRLLGVGHRSRLNEVWRLPILEFSLDLR